ncbi:serine/threonine protein kinase [Candidatus Micrarchaeota archaeon]|nr:serine/threonine protein kinase [Candidatus Micrarchaeota archaeon]MBU1886701.1 serine/threonine protein kinase [Candidatus Micrarchaeota archaeon]
MTSAGEAHAPERIYAKTMVAPVGEMKENMDLDDDNTENMSVPRGTVIGDIEGKHMIIGDLLGRGGMGGVYKGTIVHGSQIETEVAVKIILPQLMQEQFIVDLFLREAAAAAKLIGAIHVNGIISFGKITGTNSELDGSYYITMPLMKGKTLSKMYHDRTDNTKGLFEIPPDMAMNMAKQICIGIEEIHEKKIIHTDLKPENIFVMNGGSRTHLRLFDLGLAGIRQAMAKYDKKGCAFGSPWYMSPEQALGREDIDHRTDIFTLGIILYELFSGGILPYDSDEIGKLLLSISTGDPEPMRLNELNEAVSEELADIVHMCLENEPKDRFQSASEVLLALEECEKNMLEEKRESDPTMIANVDAHPLPADLTMMDTTNESPPPAQPLNIVLSPESHEESPYNESPPKKSRVRKFIAAAAITTVILAGSAIGIMHEMGTRNEEADRQLQAIAAPADEEQHRIQPTTENSAAIITPTKAPESEAIEPTVEAATPMLTKVNISTNIPRVDVYLGNKRLGTIDNVDGEFEIPRGDEQVTLTFRKEGHTPQERTITPNTDTITIADIRLKRPRSIRGPRQERGALIDSGRGSGLANGNRPRGALIQ